VFIHLSLFVSFVNNAITCMACLSCPGSCSFDKGLCPGLTNVNHNTDDFDWTIRSGSTPTLLTGPKTDHSGKGNDSIPVG